MRSRVRFGLAPRLILLLALLPSPVVGQETPAAPLAGSASELRSPSQETPNPAPEVATSDSPAVLRLRVNSVLVRVIVRDKKGTAVENLTKRDFRLSDDKKPQEITTFEVEHPASHLVPSPTGVSSSRAAATEPVVLPDRFVVLAFDDIHLQQEDAIFVREAAAKILRQLAPSDRVAIASTSGEINQDFTSDKSAMQAAFARVIARPTRGGARHNCPYITYYQADQMLNARDPDALALAISDAQACSGSDAARIAMQTASDVERQGAAETDLTFRRLGEILTRLSTAPGQRIMALVSPGFWSQRESEDLAKIIDRALRANIVIDVVDARGLTVAGSGDASSPEITQVLATMNFRLQEDFFVGSLLGEMADGTGGSWFHNRNDLDRGIGQAVAAPPVSYLLGFYPQNLKLDGRYHSLKVTVDKTMKVNVEARRGYYAPKAVENPAKLAEEEIEAALTSQEEINDLVVDLHTGFFKKDPGAAELSVTARVNTQAIRFRRQDDRNLDELTMETAIFDENGRFVTGRKKVITMSLSDATLERTNRSGFTVKSNFDIKPGTYMVRVVARDAEGAKMAARNDAVVIPF